jgi:cytidylate kinase
MKIDLKKYMNERDRLKALSGAPGPFVTISRQFGCNGDKIAIALIKRLKERQPDLDTKKGWKYLNKEIIEQSAIELKLSSDRVKQRVVKHGTDVVENIFGTIGNQFGLPDEKIIKTIKNLISDYSKNGNVIIVGRGGAAITRKIPNSLHIKLIAALDWRAGVIGRRMILKKPQAMEMIKRVEFERQMWTEHLSKIAINDDLFDIILNVQKLNKNEMLNIIIQLMEERGLIAPAKSK